MPTMADIVVKKADGTTNITYNAMTPSSGDKSKAVWRCESFGTVAANRPVFEVHGRSSVNGKFRVVDFRYTYPETYTDSTTGLVRTRERLLFSGQCAVPVDNTDASNNEGTAQGVNLLTSHLMLAVFRTGFAPT